MNDTRIRIVVVTPVFNDWASLDALISDLARVDAFSASRIHILAVDDGSDTCELPAADRIVGPIEAVDILQLKANQGHQRAIALGLAYAAENLEFDVALVLDSDGEDRPDDAGTMITKHLQSPDCLIVAQRTQRSEGVLFRTFYSFYKFLFRSLTGKAISFGNFSVIPRRKLDSILYSPGVWNNYAATLLRSRTPIAFVPTKRGTRYFGSSTMNFSTLMVHGMSAISVFSDVVIGRIIVAICALVFVLLASVLIVICGKLIIDHYGISGYLIPGYTTTVVLMLANILVSSLFVGLLVILSLLSNRSSGSALPSVLISHLIKRVVTVGGATESPMHIIDKRNVR